MACRFLSSRAHAELFEVPTDSKASIRHYLLNSVDIDLMRSRRCAESHLGLAAQIQVDACFLDEYAVRRNTRHEHHALAMHHFGLSSFGPEHVQEAEDIATGAAFATDHGVKIVDTLIKEL